MAVSLQNPALACAAFLCFHIAMVWEIFRVDGRLWFWRIRNGNRVIIVSAPHETKEECLNEIEAVKAAVGSPVVEV